MCLFCVGFLKVWCVLPFTINFHFFIPIKKLSVKSLAFFRDDFMFGPTEKHEFKLLTITLSRRERKVTQMKIDSSYYLSVLEAKEAAEAARVASSSETTQSDSTTSLQSLLDAYIPSNSEEDILYANYNDILSTMTPPPLPPAPPTDTKSSTDTDSDTTTAVSDAVKSIVSNLSESLRANEDTVLSTLEGLGLTPEDLLDPDNIELVANALNEGAEALGLPTIDDLDEIISDLKSSVESTVSSLESDYSLTEEELEAIIEELKSKILENSSLDDTTLSTLLSAITNSENTEA